MRLGWLVMTERKQKLKSTFKKNHQVWDDELARVAQKWSDQCADVDYKGDYKRQDPLIKHDKHPHRKVGELGAIERETESLGRSGFKVNR